ncbi:MAG: hypothetical protein WBD73_06175 [Candidatus Acidiferrales bacterium]
MTTNQEERRGARSGYALLSHGRYALMGLYLESMEGIEQDMAALGLVGLDSSQSTALTENQPVFPDSATKEVTALEIKREELVAIAIFLQDPMIKGVIEAVVAKVMEKILPRFERIFSRAKKESDIQYPMTISQVFFFTAMQVQITAIATLTKPLDHEIALKLFPIAFDRGIAWLLQNGRKGRYLTYRIISGTIEPFPLVSDVPAPYSE